MEAFYRQTGWQPPEARVAAADHVGLELWLLGDLTAAGRVGEVQRLLQRHLAYWLPVLARALTRLEPHPFYAALADETLDLVMGRLRAPSREVTFPRLPPAPRYRGQGLPEPEDAEETASGLKALVDHLLTPRLAGLYLSRNEVGWLFRRLRLPPTMSSRQRMLTRLFRQAGEYGETSGLIAALDALLSGEKAQYADLATRYPNWEPYARLWMARLEGTRALLTGA